MKKLNEVLGKYILYCYKVHSIRLLLIISLSFFPTIYSFSNQQSFIPLNKLDVSDEKNIFYSLERCSGLFASVGFELSKVSKTQLEGSKLLIDSTEFILKAIETAPSVGIPNYSYSIAMQESKALADLYQGEMKKSRRLTGNFFNDLILSDIQTCKQIYEIIIKQVEYKDEYEILKIFDPTTKFNNEECSVSMLYDLSNNAKFYVEFGFREINFFLGIENNVNAIVIEGDYIKMSLVSIDAIDRSGKKQKIYLESNEFYNKSDTGFTTKNSNEGSITAVMTGLAWGDSIQHRINKMAKNQNLNLSDLDSFMFNLEGQQAQSFPLLLKSEVEDQFISCFGNLLEKSTAERIKNQNN